MFPYDNLFLIDIETVPQYPLLIDAPEEAQQLWAEKARVLKDGDRLSAEELYERAGIYAEFGRIICISLGYFHQSGGQLKLRIKSLYGDDEAALLADFNRVVGSGERQRWGFAGHNIKEFDIPYLCRRMLINGLTLPKSLDVAGLKPWEVNFIDTLQLWRFGDNKNYTSLKLLAHCFGIPSPKQDIDGSQVAEVYYADGDLERIAAYCQRDVLTVAQLLLRMKNMPMLTDDQVEVAG